MGHQIKNLLRRTKQLLCLEAAVRYGSISKAAFNSGMKQSNFSAQIKDFETEIGEKILTRLSNGVQETEIGHSLYAMACDLRRNIIKTEDINVQALKQSGVLRIWTSDGIGIGLLAQCFQKFYNRYPNVKISIFCSLEMPHTDQFDIALLYEKPTEKSLNIYKEYTLKFALYASKEYLSKHGYPKSIKDLTENHRICNRENFNILWKKWDKIAQKNISAVSSVNSSAMLLYLLKDGLGIGLLPKLIASKEENLVELEKLNLNLSLKTYLVIRKDIENAEKIKGMLNIIDQVSEK